MSRNTEAPRCATCGHEGARHARVYGPSACWDCACPAFVPPADAQTAGRCECEPPKAADDHGYVCPAHEPAPRAQPAEAERCAHVFEDARTCGKPAAHWSHQDARMSRFHAFQPAPTKPPAPAALREAAERALMLAGFIADGEHGASHRLRVTRSQMQDYARQIEAALRDALREER